MDSLGLHTLRRRKHRPHHCGHILPRTRLGAGSTMGACFRGGGVMERRLQQAFFALSILALILILAAEWQANTPSWKNYQRTFLQLEAQDEPNAAAKAAVLATPLEIHQVMLTGLQRVDRCTTCHLGVDDPTLKNAPVPGLPSISRARISPSSTTNRPTAR